MDRAIITGGAGFIGQALTKYLIEKNVLVVSVVRNAEALKKLQLQYGDKLIVVECDLYDTDAVKEKLQFITADTFYHLAWFGLKDGGLTDYRIQMASVKNTMEMIEIAATCSCSKFIGTGSITQYETIYYKHQTKENDKHCIYKTAKLACELMGQEVARRNHITFIWPIITNIYGEGEKSSRLINTMIHKLLKNEDMELTDGTQLYDFIYITDACKAFYLLGQHGKANREYVIGSGEVKRLRDYLEDCPDILKSRGNLLFGKISGSGYNLPIECFSIKNLVEDTGFNAEISFGEGIEKTGKWLEEGN